MMDVSTAKRRALRELDAPDSDENKAIVNALASLETDIPGHGANRLTMLLILSGDILTREEMRKQIEGYGG